MYFLKMIMKLKLRMFEKDLIKMMTWLEADSEAIKKDLRIRTFLSQQTIGNQPITHGAKGLTKHPFVLLIIPF